MKQLFLFFLILVVLSSYASIRVFEDQEITYGIELNSYYPNFLPIAAADIDHDEAIDLLVLTNNQIYVLEQSTVGSFNFSLIIDNLIDFYNAESISLAYMNNDELYELIIGVSNHIYIYSQEEYSNYNFNFIDDYSLAYNDPESDYGYPTIAFADLNNNGFNEAVVGLTNCTNNVSPPGVYNIGEVSLYETNGYEMSFCEFLYFPAGYGIPTFTNYDHDNLADLVVALAPNVILFEQSGYNQVDFEFITGSFDDLSAMDRTDVAFCDLNHDGVDDMIYSVVPFYPEDPEIRACIRKLWANFSVEHIDGNTFRFNNNSLGDIEEYYWNFDWNFGSNLSIESTEENPIWTYDEPGTYEAILYIVNGFYNDYVSFTVEATVPSEDAILPNQNIIISTYPNPFHSTDFNKSGNLVNINFNLLKDDTIDLKICNLKGQCVKHFDNISLSKGEHILYWDGTDFNGNDVSSGIYSIIMKDNEGCLSTTKMLLLK